MRISRGVYIAAAAGSVLLVGAIALAATSSPPQAPLPGPPLPPPPPVHPAVPIIPTWSHAVPDEFVTDAQIRLVRLIADGKLPGTTAGAFNLPLFAATDIDGKIDNPKFVEALAFFQKLLAPSVKRITINTSGLLDYMTDAMLVVAFIQQYGYQLTFQIVDPGIIAMAEKAFQDQNKYALPAPNVPIDGTVSASFLNDCAFWQKQMQGEPFPGIAMSRTDGIFDLWTLSTLLVQAYAV